MQAIYSKTLSQKQTKTFEYKKRAKRKLKSIKDLSFAAVPLFFRNKALCIFS